MRIFFSHDDESEEFRFELEINVSQSACAETLVELLFFFTICIYLITVVEHAGPRNTVFRSL